MQRNKNSNRVAAAVAAAAAAVALAVLGVLATVADDSAAQNSPPELSLNSAATFPVDI
ncbi:MAG: hypothetical protein OXU94_06135 [Gammaproteobacteria bacterium]|nr:hypothetical protein [Gammaproteobacteria bacterium]